MTESYAWNLGTGLLHLSTHEGTKGVGGKGKEKASKSLIQKKGSQENTELSLVDLMVL